MYSMKKLLAAALILASTHTTADGEAWALYRGTADPDVDEIYIAAFDVHYDSSSGLGGASYNQENCEIAREAFMRRPEVSVSYWCLRVIRRPDVLSNLIINETISEWAYRVLPHDEVCRSAIARNGGSTADIGGCRLVNGKYVIASD